MGFYFITTLNYQNSRLVLNVGVIQTWVNQYHWSRQYTHTHTVYILCGKIETLREIHLLNFGHLQDF